MVMKKKITLGVLVPILILVAVVLVNTFTYRSKQFAVDKVKLTAVDEAKASKHLADLIAFRTISYKDANTFNYGEFLSLHEYLQENYPLTHQHMQKELVNQYSLLYMIKGSEPSLKPLLFMAHQDVVPIEPGTENNWTHPPFSGRIADGYIWGRGSLDVKCGITGALEAMEILLQSGFKPRRTLYFAFGHDEEVGGVQGAAKISRLLQSRGVKLELVLDEGGAIMMDDSLGFNKPMALIGIAEKGYTSVELSINTSGGHSSMPPDHTSIGLICSAIHRLEQNPFPAKFAGATKIMFDYLGPEMGFVRKMFFANQWLFKPLISKIFLSKPESAAMIRTTTAATIFNAGVKDNVIPQKARAVVNFRILPGETPETVKGYVQKVIDNRDIDVKIMGFSKAPSPVSTTSCEAFTLLSKSIKQQSPQVLIVPYLMMGATDARYYYPLTDHVYRFMALPMVKSDLSRVHGTDERINIKNYIGYIQFLIQLIKNFNI
jgi:carboxypeptidase PM20D1